MKLTVPTKTLANALQKVAAAATSRSTLPILGNVQLTAETGALTLYTTDLDLFLTERVEADVDKPGAITLPFRMLNALVSRVTTTAVRLETRKGRVELTAGEVTATFETLPSEEFPPLLEAKGSSFECATEELLAPFKMVAHAISDAPSDYHLQGVSLRSTKAGIDFAATNRNLLAVFRSDLQWKGVNAIVPEAAVIAALRNLSGDTCSVIIGEGTALFRTGDTEIRSKLVEGMYPNYEQVIPKAVTSAFSATRAELLEAVTTAALFQKTNEIGVQLEGSGKQIAVACGDRFRAMVLGSDLGGQPSVKLNLNARYVRGLLSSMQGEFVRAEVTDELTPVAFREGPFTGVMLPLRA